MSDEKKPTKVTDHETFSENPFQKQLGKNKSFKFGWRHVDPAKAKTMVDQDTGETVFVSNLGNVKLVLKDTTEFTKLFGPACKEILKLSTPGIKMLGFLFSTIKRDMDTVEVDVGLAMEWTGYTSRTNVYSGLCSLLEHGFICRKTGTGGTYYINVNYFFNGKRTNLQYGGELKGRIVEEVKKGRRKVDDTDIDSVDKDVEE